MKNWTDYGVPILVPVIFLLVILGLFSLDKWADCEKLGGTTIKTSGGYVCAKIEKIELKASKK